MPKLSSEIVGRVVASYKPSHKSSQVNSYSPGYMEQAPSKGHEASPYSGLGVGCKLFSGSKKAAWARCTCAGAAHNHLSLII